MGLVTAITMVFFTEISRYKNTAADHHNAFTLQCDSFISSNVFSSRTQLENVLIDAKRNVKITDFGLSALPQHLREDGLLHTTCGSPNYVAPEILSNRGYNGATSDTWSCGVILYVILTGYLPFDDRNMAVLYQKVVLASP